MEKRLGKGLGALIPEDAIRNRERIESLKITEVFPNKLQPRKRFGSEKMEDLKNSIREKGLIQPVLVRQQDNGYELIAGERRWRAAKELAFEEIPAIIKKGIEDVSSLELSLIENIQREELNPIEEANAYKELMDKFEYTLDKVGQMVGKNKTTISNSLRLLNLPGEIIGYLEAGQISTGHAKVLLSVTSANKQKQMAQTILKHDLSVRQLEEMLKETPHTRTRTRKEKDPEAQRIEEELQHHLGTKVNIRHGKKRGRLEIHYYSNEDLQRLLNIILRPH